MKHIVDDLIRSASWPRVLFSIVILAAYSAFLFRADGDYATALAAASALPEIQPSIPADHSAALAALHDASAIEAYKRFQYFDIIFALFNFAALSSLIALAFNRYGLMASPFRFILIAPMIMASADILENIAIVTMITGNPIATHMQPIFTLIKFLAGAPSTVIAVLSALALIAYLGAKVAKQNSAQ